jgi:hypothetical protein
MLFTATSTASLLSAVGTISSGVFDSAYAFLIVAIGIPLGFYIIKALIGLMPKSRGRR